MAIPTGPSDTVTLHRAHLLAASALVPPSRRTEFFAIALMGPDVVEMTHAEAAETPEGDFESYPLTAEQARKLKDNVGKDTWSVLAAAANNVQDGVATINWAEVKALTGVKNWSVFAQGRLGGLHRSLRKIVGSSDATLLWEGEGWVEDGLGDYSAGLLCIDGPAVKAIQTTANRSPTISPDPAPTEDKKSPEATFGAVAKGGVWDSEAEDSFFCVEASDDVDTEDAAVIVYFSNREQASTFAAALNVHEVSDHATARRFDCVWMSEWGTWRTKAGKSKTEFMYFWWSQGVARTWDDLPSAGSGLPFSKCQNQRISPKLHEEYEPAR